MSTVYALLDDDAECGMLYCFYDSVRGTGMMLLASCAVFRDEDFTFVFTTLFHMRFIVATSFHTNTKVRSDQSIGQMFLLWNIYLYTSG